MVHHILLILAVLGTSASLAYYLLCLLSASVFLRKQKVAGDCADPASFPPVSILKPLKGTDPEMYESFRTHCVQDYPEYEIIFGISDLDDPAKDLVARLQLEFPKQAIRLIYCDQDLGPNRKVSNLAQMARVAKYEILLVNDSDIRVPCDYLRRVLSGLSNESIGVITCLYRGVAGRSLGSRLEALGISTDFIPGVLVARFLEGGIHFALGSTLAFRRRELAAIGGFEAIVDYLADDYELGRRIAALGFKVEVADRAVETFLPNYSFREFLAHQMRWARTVRDARPGGYFGLIFTFGLPWAVLALILAGGAAWAWLTVALVLLLRLASGFVVADKILQDRQFRRFWFLIPLRDFVAAAVWAASFAGKKISWRGEEFELRNGKLSRLIPDA